MMVTLTQQNPWLKRAPYRCCTSPYFLCTVVKVPGHAAAFSSFSGVRQSSWLVKVVTDAQPCSVPSAFGRNLQCQPVRGVNTREECHWSHACQRFKRRSKGAKLNSTPRVYIAVGKRAPDHLLAMLSMKGQGPGLVAESMVQSLSETRAPDSTVAKKTEHHRVRRQCLSPLRYLVR
jgi:hypothetical protein